MIGWLKPVVMLRASERYETSPENTNWLLCFPLINRGEGSVCQVFMAWARLYTLWVKLLFDLKNHPSFDRWFFLSSMVVLHIKTVITVILTQHLTEDIITALGAVGCSSPLEYQRCPESVLVGRSDLYTAESSTW